MARRFSYSSPGRRGPSDPWFRVGEVDVGTTLVVTALCVISVLVWAIDKFQLLRIALIPDNVRSGQVWRVATWPFANIPLDTVLWTAISIALFWYFGKEVERLVGRNRMAIFLAILTVVPGVAGALINTPQAGIEPIEFGVFLVFVIHQPFARFFFGIPAWVLGLVLIGIQVVQLLGNNDDRGLIFLAVTLAVAALCARAMNLGNDVPWIPALPIPGLSGPGSGSAGRRRPSRPRAPRSRGGVVAGPWSERGTGSATLPQPPADGGAQAELDDLLDKISGEGIDALSSSEKRRLNELSKRLRDR